jgi:L-rhamnose isomerase/sugar isomerase
MSSFSDIADALEALAIEVPSWAYGNSGTRFKVFGSPGTPRTVEEKIADAAAVHRFTGLAPTVALHIPWDRVDDYGKLTAHAEDHGVRLGTVNSNTFQDDDYKLGSLTHVDPAVRRKAIQHNLDCIDVMDETGSRDLKIWLADGTNYPGQGDIRARQDWLAEGLAEIYARSARTSGWCWSTSSSSRRSTTPTCPTGARRTPRWRPSATARWCAWTPGHHAPGTNIEFIVAQLLRLGKLGSFDFNSRFYADDDLIVGAADPFQLFRILVEVVRGGGYGPGSDGRTDAGPVPQHRGQGARPDPLGAQRAGDAGASAASRRPDMKQALDAASKAGDVLAANEIFMDAFYTDVRRDMAGWREERGLQADPMKAYLASGYQQQIEADRVGGAQAGWN